ncbi:L,D-transpeptidase [Sphingobacterium sp. SRCM116780]|uniref:L,D-transpeptidase n=1 Tax=Sphingobacterium sp. SRCM116780 TaxID=2907623 RepID=UPI001F2EE824|nr:L,D-transpeptidase [Sphingobacterium sp. SRCM116780]UIR57782.1 L,D-transpeptidase [Sphingobacterium sp. SRCM116780]
MKYSHITSILLYSILVSALFISCQDGQSKNNRQDNKTKHTADSLAEIKKKEIEIEKSKPKKAEDIEISKDLQYDKYTLEDTYPYKDTVRHFQWDKIKERLAFVENFQDGKSVYGVLQNYQNSNGEAPTISNFKRDVYKRVTDSLGTERYQAAPLYSDGETKLPTIYGKDGWLVKLQSSDTLEPVKVEGVSFNGVWEVPKKYLKTIGDSVIFDKVIVVDVTNQNICTLDRTEKGWVVRSMNPSTTGRHKPPHAQETPTGMYVIQEHKSKMFYYKDGTKTYEGYAPFASRFTAGAYIHGVPVNNPKGSIVEYSSTLGTIPRSHMCVRNASSHAQFVYKRSKDFQTLVIIID